MSSKVVINLTEQFKALAGNVVVDESTNKPVMLNQVLAAAIASMPCKDGFPPMKVLSWAQDLYDGNSLSMDHEDVDKLKMLVGLPELRLSVLVVGRVLRIITDALTKSEAEQTKTKAK